MFYLVWLAIFGLIVGLIGKAVHPGEDPEGFLPTIGIGIAGSYIGGLINWLMGNGAIFSTSGFLLSIVGSVILLAGYKYWKSKQ